MIFVCREPELLLLLMEGDDHCDRRMSLITIRIRGLDLDNQSRLAQQKYVPLVYTHQFL